MADNSTMSPAWAIYCERLGGWLVDTSFVWSWDVAECAEFETALDAERAIYNMQKNYGEDVLQGSDALHFIRIR